MNSFILIVLLVKFFDSEKLTEGSSIFERTFNNLHHEPPSSKPTTRNSIQTKWIEQKLDHFDEKENSTWMMRYKENNQYFEYGGPIFIFVGGEWEISSGNLIGGHMHDMAKEHNGYLFYTEHRYYGKSHPTKNLSSKNLKYLHVRQALADLAHFIRHKKQNNPAFADSAVILTGGSYSATMVIWFKRLYPELATGCWASSAPLYAKPDFYEYKEITGESIKLVGSDLCYDRIRDAIRQLEKMIENGNEKEVKDLLNICNSFDSSNELDVWTLFSEISDMFAGLVQTHVDGNIQKACKTILSEEDDLSGLLKYLRPQFNQKPCNKITYKEYLKVLSDISFSGGGIIRQWFYQTCDEYGWYQTSTSDNQPFGKYFPVQLYINLCTDAYEEQFNFEIISNKTSETNEFFGGLNPNVSNVYITHGQLDPWRGMGLQDPEQAQIIPLHAHCKDLGSISPKDSSALRSSKEKIAQLVREWVKAK